MEEWQKEQIRQIREVLDANAFRVWCLLSEMIGDNHPRKDLVTIRANLEWAITRLDIVMKYEKPIDESKMMRVG